MTLSKLFFTSLSILLLLSCGGGSSSDGGSGQTPQSNPNNIAPTISLLGDDSMIIGLNEPFNDPGAMAIDTEDGDISSNIVVDSSLDTSTDGIYTLSYSVVDSDGASSETIERTVLVAMPLVLDTSDELIPAFDTILDPETSETLIVTRLAYDDVEADFIEGELLVASNDFAAVMSLATRWGGSIISTVEFDGIEDLYTLRINPAGVDTTGVAEHAKTIGAMEYGELLFSSTEGLELFAVALKESAETGMAVSVNFLMESDAISDGVTIEEANGSDGYSSNAFQWPYMNLGSAQDTGVGASWQLLELLGRENPQEIMIFDGGFIQSDDLPLNSQVLISDWGQANPGSCGGNPCPWHGTQVAHVAAALPDNGIGIAGSAGNHASLTLVQFWPITFRGLARFMGEALAAPFNGPPTVINVSASARIPLVANVALNAIMDPVSDFLHRNGVLIVASAGNDSRDVDKRWRGPFGRLYRFEDSTIIPCETSSVVCVGGLDWDQIVKADGSNYGSDAEADSVDIYSPYQTWAPTYDDVGNALNTIERISGTSFSAPFVSGIVALMRSANPNLSAQATVRCLLSTAHTFGRVHTGGGNQRRVNAFAAVNCALNNTVSYPLLTLQQPENGLTVFGGETIPLQASSLDSTGELLGIEWTSDIDGLVIINGSGSQSDIQFLSPGTHTLTASVTGEDGTTRSESVEVTVQNNPPTVDIISPAEDGSIREGQLIRLVANSFDVESRGRLEESQISWRVEGTSFNAAGHVAEIPAGLLAIGDYTLTVTANDGDDTASQSINFSIGACSGECPTIAITSPTTTVVRSSARDENGAYYADFNFSGNAVDPEDGNLSTQIFWTVTNDSGNRTSLCFPITNNDDPLNPGLGITIECDEFTARLYEGNNLIEAQIVDEDGNVSIATIVITIILDLI